MCNKADNSCRQEKLGCKGCFYNKNDDVDDIEFIKHFIAELKILNSSASTLLPMNYRLEKSLLNILKENEELKFLVNCYNNEYFIEKSKIEEKIKEIDNFPYSTNEERDEHLYAIEVLNELLKYFK